MRLRHAPTLRSLSLLFPLTMTVAHFRLPNVSVRPMMHMTGFHVCEFDEIYPEKVNMGGNKTECPQLKYLSLA